MSTRDENERIELLQGTLDLLILRTLLLGPIHGHAISKAIERNSEDVLQVEQGSLYPALHRLIRRGWIAAQEGVSENNRRAKFYRLTPKGGSNWPSNPRNKRNWRGLSPESCGLQAGRVNHELRRTPRHRGAHRARDT